MPGYVVQEHAQSSPDPDSDVRTTSENLTADCRRPGTLSICVARSVHICPVCACAAHIYQFVLILGHRRRRARGVGAEGSWELPGHQLRGHYQLLPTESRSSFRPKRIILSFLLPHRTLVLITSYISPLGEILKRFPKMKIPAGFIFLTPQSTAFS